LDFKFFQDAAGRCLYFCNTNSRSLGMRQDGKFSAFVYLLVILAMVFWGMSYVWTTMVFRYLNPITTIFLRLVISSALLFFIFGLTHQLQPVRKKDYKLFLFAALFEPFLYFLGEGYGVKYSTPTISAIIISTIPIFSAIAASIFLKEVLQPLQIFGFFLSLGGIIFMLLGPNFSFQFNPIGIVSLFFAVATAVIYAVLLKRLTMLYSSFTIVAWLNFIGAFYFLPLVLIVEPSQLTLLHFEWGLWYPLIMLAVFASSLAFIFFTFGMHHLGVSRTSIFTNFIPVFTAIFSYFKIHEKLTVNTLVGMLMVIVGVIITQKNVRIKTLRA
ncbi:MAG TPA: DMT family transporter, partial [Bacteroidales bacterium]|nr:DMT family transporter [Bacteroidales bacterium]